MIGEDQGILFAASLPYPRILFWFRSGYIFATGAFCPG
jgi:hypothetical protein